MEDRHHDGDGDGFFGGAFGDFFDDGFGDMKFEFSASQGIYTTVHIK